jgi:hypothetical protein
MTDEPRPKGMAAPLGPIEAHTSAAIRFLLSPWISVPSFPIAWWVFVSDAPATLSRWGIPVLILLFLNFLAGILDVIRRVSAWLPAGYHKVIAVLGGWEGSLRRASARVLRLFG